MKVWIVERDVEVNEEYHDWIHNVIFICASKEAAIDMIPKDHVFVGSQDGAFIYISRIDYESPYHIMYMIDGAAIPINWKAELIEDELIEYGISYFSIYEREVIE